MTKVLLFSMLFISTIFSQQESRKTPFISANLGIYNIAENNFDQVYNSKIGFLPGITVGLPLSSCTYLYGKVSYFAKDGVPVNYTYILQNGNLVLSYEGKGGSAKFSEWLFNAGILYNFFLSDDFTLGINGGVVFVSLNETKNGPANSYSITNTGGGWLGFFGGVNLEKNFVNSPFSLIAEIQYNLSRGDIQSFAGNYGGLNINLGGRFYFNARRTL